MPSTKLKANVPIGLSIPLKNAGIGFFEQTFDTFTATKTNIINLLRTRPGERRMQPLFGCRLYNTVFEQNTEILPEVIKNIVKEDIGNWISNVSVNNVNVKFYKNEENNNTDTYRVYVSVTFTVTNVDQSGNIELVISSNGT